MCFFYLFLPFTSFLFAHLFYIVFCFSYHFLHLRSKTHVEIHEWVLYTCCCCCSSTLYCCFFFFLLTNNFFPFTCFHYRSICLFVCVGFVVYVYEWVCVEFNCHKIIKRRVLGLDVFNTSRNSIAFHFKIFSWSCSCMIFFLFFLQLRVFSRVFVV